MITSFITSALLCSTVASFAVNEGTVTANTLNVRSGPGVNYSILFKLSKNNKIKILDSSKGWYRIQYDKKTGWVSGAYIKMITTSENSTVYKQTTARVNFRSGPSTNSSIITTLNSGVKVRYIEFSGSWSKVEYGGKYGYVSSQYLKSITNTNTNDNINKDEATNGDSTNQNSNGGMYKVIASSLNIRSKSSTSGSILGKFYKNENIYVNKVVNGWAEVTYKGRIAYCSMDYLEKINNNQGSSDNQGDSGNQESSENSKYYLDIKYKEIENQEIITVTSSNELKYSKFFLENPDRLVIDFDGYILKNNILNNEINEKYIKTYRANYDSTQNTTRLVVEFEASIDKDKININNKEGNSIEIVFGEKKIEQPVKNNYLQIEYKEYDNKEMMIVNYDKSINYSKFYLDNPTRLVIDISNAKLEKNILDQALNKNYVKLYRANYDSTKDVTRLVIEFDSKFDKNNILLTKKDSSLEILFNKEKNNEINYIPSIPSNLNATYRSISKTFDEYIKDQENRYYVISKNGKFVKATVDELIDHVNPAKTTLDNKEYVYQFLSLDKYRNINVSKLNEYLNTLKPINNKNNIFKNKGQVFANASKTYSIDPLYFVSHIILETGNGGSALAQGYEVELDEKGKAIRYHYSDADGNLVYDSKGNPVEYVKLKDENTPIGTPTVKVYNLLGIGAVDSRPIEGGTTTAYDNGWTTVDKAIEGGAKWVSTNYINSSKYQHQNTLYFMRWDYVNGWHQYSTDVGWPVKIGKNINKISYIYQNLNTLDYIIPKYK